MTKKDGNAIVYCQGAYGTTNGKTAHGLVRFTTRYQVLSVVDARLAGQDAGFVLDRKNTGIPIFGSIEEAVEAAKGRQRATHMVVGLAPDGGRLSEQNRQDVRTAISLGLHVDCGLHDFLTEDDTLVELATRMGVTLRDIRKPPAREHLHFFSGKIESVDSLKIALLGTDSAVGKRTTAWLLVHGLREIGVPAELIGTGQTAWLQGARYGIIMDCLVNDFVSGEIEHAIWSCWKDKKPAIMVIEGQGSLLNPAYPGGFEIMAAGRPDMVILQHAPSRKEYDGFPGYRIHPLRKQISAVEMIAGKPVVAITVNHENMTRTETVDQCALIQNKTGRPAFDPLLFGAKDLVHLVMSKLQAHPQKTRKSA